MSAPLAGKAVLVTGASAGIGRAAAVALAQKGAKIIATGRRRTELDALAQQCGGGAVTSRLQGRQHLGCCAVRRRPMLEKTAWGANRRRGNNRHSW